MHNSFSVAHTTDGEIFSVKWGDIYAGQTGFASGRDRSDQLG